MQRKTTLATAAAVTLVLLAGSAAAATNLGLLDSTNQTGSVGQLTPQEASQTAAQPDTVIVEPAAQPRSPVDDRTTVQPGESDDQYESDDDYEADDDHASGEDQEHDDDREYEGHDDDD
jgi:hypothetical protein